VIWQVDRTEIAKSHMNRIIGTPYYKQITIRSNAGRDTLRSAFSTVDRDVSVI
jgi:hypothetical protein